MKMADVYASQFDPATQTARLEVVKLAEEFLPLAGIYIPLIGQAAAKNFAIMDQAVRPLVTWLAGPDGIGIFENLTAEFAQRLPAAINAGAQAIEFFARSINIASQYSGGFMADLDKLFTHLNSLDDATIGAEISKLIADFRLWEKFVKALITDIYLLFHQDVGTGNSIIGALTGMLLKLQAYERSSRGSSQLQSIFEIHKQEVLELLTLFGELSKTFGSVYLAIAPPLVGIVNSVVLPVLNAVAKVIDAIAHSSTAAALAIGGLIIAMRGFGIAAVAGGLTKAAGLALGGTAVAAGGATAAGGTAVAGAALTDAEMTAALGGGGGIATLLASGGLTAAIAGAATAALPVVLAGGAAVAAFEVAKAVFGGAPATRIAPGSGPGGSLAITGGPAAPNLGRLAGKTLTFGDVGTTNPLAGAALDIKKVGDYSNYSEAKLQTLIDTLKIAGSVKVNGVPQVTKDVLAMADAALKVKEDWNDAFDSAWTDVNTFYRNASTTLPALYDDFDTNMREIAETMGTNSAKGRSWSPTT